MAEHPTVESGARSAEQQSGTSPVNVKELLGQLEPEVRDIAQTAINSVAKKLTDGFQQKQTALEAEIATLKEQNAAFSTFRQELEQTLGGDDDLPPDQLTEIERQLTPPAHIKTPEARRLWGDIARRNYIQEQRFNALVESDEASRKTISQLQKQIEEEKQSRTALEQSRANALLSAELARIGAELDVVSIPGFAKIHRENCVFDDKTGQWMYRVGDESFPLRVGLEKHTEDWLRKPVVTEGGSGGRGARGSDPQVEMKAAEQELLAAQERAGNTGSMADIAAFQRAQRKLRQLKNAAA